MVEENFLGPDLDRLAEGTELAVIDFSATWCGPCKRYDPVFERMAQDLTEEGPDRPVAFLKVDVDRNQALARELGVKSVPTTVIAAREKRLIFGETWSEKVRFSGIVPYPRLRQAVDGQIEAL